MVNGKIQNISIKAISCVLPENIVKSVDRYSDFGKEAVDKIIDKTGVESIFQALHEQTASDLAYIAAKRIIDTKKIDPKSIGALILVTQTPDYRMPATAFVLQHRLDLSDNCICFDINLGCSGYINGLFTITSLMTSSSIDRALLLVAETPSKRISSLDRSLSMIFGDCGTATFLEKESNVEPMDFMFKSFGDRFKKIIIPAGAYRNIGSSYERVMWNDGNVRSDYDTYMHGQDVFAFTIMEVPQYIKEYMIAKNKDESDYDFFILHQANQYILKQIAKKIKTKNSKIPISMHKYGNTSSTSIPLTLSYLNEVNSIKDNFNMLLSAFGIGLSFAIADIKIDLNNILPIFHSNDYYKDGEVKHD